MQASAKPNTNKKGEVIMGLFDEIKNAVGAQIGGENPEATQKHSGLINAALQMFGNREGIADLQRRFESRGMGDIVSSWIATGANRSVHPGQLQNALGEDRIQELAQRAGLPAEAVKQKLATILPVVIDKLTPQGRVPEEMKKAS
jgi:uncharacterized protein YidB (DUF937 family)